MSRIPITLRGFNKGMNLKGDLFGDPSFLRLVGFKFGQRAGVLESRGGWEDWDTSSTDWTYINGIKRWYREDGGVNLFAIGTGNGTRNLYYYDIHRKQVVLLTAISGIIDDEYPVQWIDCGSQLIVLPFANGRPYSIKLNQIGDEGGIIVRQLGLSPPTESLLLSHVVVRGGINATVNQFDTFKYCMTYSYGTKSEPEKYGESGAGPSISNTLYPTFGAVGDDLVFTLSGITPLSGTGIIKKINIYRTKENLNTFLKVGEITEPGVTTFSDGLDDSKIGIALGTGKTLPIYTGVANKGMRCALWHPGLKRLFWFGFDGYLHWSAPGQPDVNPDYQKMEVGNLGFNGNSIFHVQNSIYAFKEDGIFIIQGDAPNYFSRKISSVNCISRMGAAELSDGYYFPGVESKVLKIYKFDGNRAYPISESINNFLPFNKSSVIKRMFGKRVGEEYWLSLMINDLRFCNYPTPFNNVIIMYDTRYQDWVGTLPCQASSIEVFDGPGDSGEVFITESDPTSDTNKGSFFRLEKRRATLNQTTYAGGARVYTKSATIPRRITFGVLSGSDPQDQSLENIEGMACRIRAKGYLGKLPSYRLYDDSKELEKIISSGNAETGKLKSNDLILTGITASVVGPGKVGHATCVGSQIEDFEFAITDDKLRTGIATDISFDTPDSKFIEIEGLELLIDTTGKE